MGGATMAIYRFLQKSAFDPDYIKRREKAATPPTFKITTDKMAIGARV